MAHLIKTFTDRSCIEVSCGQILVTLYWQLNIDDTLIHYFNKGDYVHDLAKVRTEGRLSISLSTQDLSKASTLAYAECLAAKHLLSSRGANIFGFDATRNGIAMSVRRDHIVYCLSQAKSHEFLYHRPDCYSERFRRYGKAYTASSVCSSFVSGTQYKITDNSDIKRESSDHIVSASELLIRSSDNVTCQVGTVVIDQSGLDAYCNDCYIRYATEVLNQEIPRPFETLMAVLQNATATSNYHQEKKRRKFGSDCISVKSTSGFCCITIKPIRSSRRLFRIVDVSHFVSGQIKNKMIEAGYAEGWKARATLK